ncbi:hypothetical protein Q4519_06025 [Motilimonas sp. 1_MG-2023]|uniref:hypothetical protein n=1 Tax=Motilimonas sp. 1_MG-2023 TaxID=3062672 RepID=UPI0026E2C345|nr:hypothetical protein [Motilimonas sp. 1_MG-2023]MDO6525237.1 hypothetical protein [Motilimonas sp. 1_MG-2023]
MNQISFDLSLLQTMLAEAKKAPLLTPTYDDLWNPDCYPGGELLDESGQTEGEVVLSGDEFWPGWQHIVQDKIKPQLILMAEGIHGIYIINNVGGDIAPVERGMICFAKGFNPKTHPQQLKQQQRMFGKDGHAFVVPLKWLEISANAGKKSLVIDVSDTECELSLD